MSKPDPNNESGAGGQPARRKYSPLDTDPEDKKGSYAIAVAIIGAAATILVGVFSSAHYYIQYLKPTPTQTPSPTPVAFVPAPDEEERRKRLDERLRVNELNEERILDEMGRDREILLQAVKNRSGADIPQGEKARVIAELDTAREKFQSLRVRRAEALKGGQEIAADVLRKEMVELLWTRHLSLARLNVEIPGPPLFLLAMVDPYAPKDNQRFGLAPFASVDKAYESYRSALGDARIKNPELGRYQLLQKFGQEHIVDDYGNIP